jgi:hypothetical protein
MKCYRCKQTFQENEWTTRGDRGPRHLSCPSKTGQKAQRRKRQVKRFLKSQSS